MFMQDAILPHVIFSPGTLAKQLAEGLQAAGHDVFLFTPGSIATTAHNITSNTSLFEAELAARGDTAVSLLKKHPLTFITLARQLQAELIAQAYKMANDNRLDIVHVYTNEEEIALTFADLCQKPVVFTHHDPFNFLVRYKAVMPKYRHLNWISLSFAQRETMPKTTHWVANIYHGLDPTSTILHQANADKPYVLFMGRIIEAKGLHLAIQAVQQFNKSATIPLRLEIAGKHYAGKKDQYWQNHILPLINDPNISYRGFINDPHKKSALVAGAQALMIPSTFHEPFGMVMIEALAVGTPVIGLDSGAIKEVVKHGETGFVVPILRLMKDSKDVVDETSAVKGLVHTLQNITTIDRTACRTDFEARFTLDRMVQEHIQTYEHLVS
jgi:glycosyltransferase involved in cell wall biosynthesis